MKKLYVLLAVMLLVGLSALAASKKAALFNFQDSEVGQTGTIATVTLFTPATDVDYQVCLYVENTNPHTGTVHGAVTWTDDNGSQSHFVNTANSAGECFPIHALNGNAVTLDGTDFGNSQTYSLFVTAIGQ